MPLTLITGPANARKAGALLDGYGQALDAGAAPVLVVPTFADVQHYRAELAGRGVVFGSEVVRFEWLLDEIARRVGVRGRRLRSLGRERVAGAAVRRTELDALAGAATGGGLARALLRLADELGESGVTPQRLSQALAAWSRSPTAGDAARARYATEVAALYRAYRQGLERLHRADAPLHAGAVVQALREAPERWGATPVLVYGFDDLTVVQRQAVEELSRAGAEVTVSLAYEAGRLAFGGRATTFQELKAAVAQLEHVALPASPDYAAPALHHLERRLFEPALPGTGALFEPEPVAPGDAVTLLQGGGERAELELVATEAARLVRREGIAPEEVAVVLRAPATVAPLITQVFAEVRLPIALGGRVALGHTPLGRAVVGLLRSALARGGAEDLLAWLRAPGLLRRPGLADELEAAARREGARTADAARELWEAEHWPLDAIDRLRAAQRRGPTELLGALSGELSALFAAPRRRQAIVLAGAEEQDARVLAAGRRALDELATLARADPSLVPAPDELADLLAAHEVPVGARPAPGRVTVADPLTLRARRVRALFACRLQEGIFPTPARPEPLFSATERAELAAASGLVLRGEPDVLAAERYLFYATVSRPTERLYLSWHEASEDGEAAVRSFFVSDVCDLFGPELVEQRRTRALGAAGWPAELAPTSRERLRAETTARPPRREPVISPLADPELRGELGGDRPVSGSALELWASCPVRWFVERRLRPEGLAPDPEAMLRGALAHAVLEATLRGLREQTGSARVHAGSLPVAIELALGALERLAPRPELRMSTDPRRQRAMVLRQRADLIRYLQHTAQSGSELEPTALEVGFGGPGDEHGALELAGGVRVRGRIDRIDTGPDGEAIVYDYKGRRVIAPDGWRRERRYQIAMYVLAARDVLGMRPVGGLYQPLGGVGERARGIVLQGADPGLATVGGDRRAPEDFEAVVDGVLEDVLCAAAQMREGALEPRPETCAYEGGCAYPTICRSEA